jgi:hypothetical protein
VTPALPTARAARDALRCARFTELLWRDHCLGWLVRLAVLIQSAEVEELQVVTELAALCGREG